MRDFKKLVPGILVPILLATALWRPALFSHKTIIHGDSILHGLALLNLQYRAFPHLIDLLWSNDVYGGHPLFAEGQGGFLNPINMICAWIVAPLFGSIYAMNALHWLSMIAAAIGVAALCRRTGASPWASAFAGLAVPFSLIWIGAEQNLTISCALLWVPWIIWATERWLDRPDFGTAALLGAMGALEVLAGYPQALHGALLYTAVLILARLAGKESRSEWRRGWNRRLTTGIGAVAIGLGISAIQWLPQLELATLSHRNAGVAIFYHVPIASYLRGFLFSVRVQGAALYFPVASSLLVSVLASLSLVMGLSARTAGHLAAAILLTLLGMERNSGFFSFSYDHDLIPGLHYFRTVHIYLNVAIIAVAVLAAAAIDGLSRLATKPSETSAPLANLRMRILGVGAIALLWVGAVVALHIPMVRTAQYVIDLAAFAGIAVLILVRRAHLIPILMTVALAGECAKLRLHEYHFADADILRTPDSITRIEARPDWRDFKIYDDSLAAAFGFVHPQSPELEHAALHMLAAGAGLANLLWDLPSMDGALALPLSRRMQIEPLIKDEVEGHTSAPPGARLIDLLSVRYVAFDALWPTPAFKNFWHGQPDSVWIMENTAARPRFQMFSQAAAVVAASSDEAQAKIEHLQSPALVVENAESQRSAPPAAADDDAGMVEVVKARPTSYRFKIAASKPAWFFMADANYPGWRAYLDGAIIPVRSAQILGKAVEIPAGMHDLKIEFRPASVIWGAWISAITLVSTILALTSFRMRR